MSSLLYVVLFLLVVDVLSFSLLPLSAPRRSLSPAATSKGIPEASVEWDQFDGTELLLPQGVQPLGVVHFTGGQVVGSVPRSAYGPFLEGICSGGYIVVAPPAPFSQFDHTSVACDSVRDFRRAYRELETLYGRATLRRMPVFGVGHSLGAKLQVLLNSYPDVREVAMRRK
ncbi:unnamed protein product, partial [Chrysoparadoxa australica]